MLKYSLLAAAITLLATSSVHAATIVGYASTNGTAVAPTDVSPNVTGLNLTRGDGLFQDTGSTFNSRGFGGGTTVTTAVTANDYTSFGFTVQPGFSAGVSMINFGYDRSPTGPLAVTLRSSVDSFATDLFSDSSVNVSGEAVSTSDLGLTGLTGTVEFRLYGFNASGTTGTFDYEDRQVGNTRAIMVNGTVTAVTAIPEPLAAFGGLVMLGATLLPRRKAVG